MLQPAAIVNGQYSFPLSQRQCKIIHVSCNMINIALMERRFNEVKYAPNNPKASEPAHPHFSKYLRWQILSDSIKYPFNAKTAVRFALVMYYPDSCIHSLQLSLPSGDRHVQFFLRSHKSGYVCGLGGLQSMRFTAPSGVASACRAA